MRRPASLYLLFLYVQRGPQSFKKQSAPSKLQTATIQGNGNLPKRNYPIHDSPLLQLTNVSAEKEIPTNNERQPDITKVSTKEAP